jgi:hypothetical protein
MSTDLVEADKREGEKVCFVCGYCVYELFGYRISDRWYWFCANHRLGKCYADQRWLPGTDGEGS